MSQRYFVYDGHALFASVIATTNDKAIQIACAKTDDHDPDRCVAIPVAQDDSPIELTMRVGQGSNRI